MITKGKRLGKRMLKFRWQTLTSKWIIVFRERNRSIVEMIAEILTKNHIPVNIKLDGALAPLGGYPFGSEVVGSRFAIEVPETYMKRAEKILDEAISK